MSDFKGHSPQLGCRWYECKGSSSTECPFKAGSKLAVANPPDECLHEWRQYWKNSIEGPRPSGFFCVWCRDRTVDD
jgi:hypothetical protein